MKIISIIVAVDQNFGIGNENKLLCHLPADMKRFKDITAGHPVIMGRKTWESLKIQPLPNRQNIILTSQKDYLVPGAEIANSIDDALKLCQKESEIFIIGGDSVYKQFLPITNKIYLTQIHEKFPSDTFFPEIEISKWKIMECIEYQPDEKNKFSYTFLTLTH